jgi:hypothetical protein
MRDFSYSALDMLISFEILNQDGDDDPDDETQKVPILRGLLRDDYGEWKDAAVSLAEKISNQNGTFVLGTSLKAFALGKFHHQSPDVTTIVLIHVCSRVVGTTQTGNRPLLERLVWVRRNSGAAEQEDIHG